MRTVPIEATLIQLQCRWLGLRRIEGPEIWDAADSVLEELSATMTEGTGGTVVEYQVHFRDKHVLAGEVTVFDVAPDLGELIRTELEVVCGLGNETYCYQSRGRQIWGLGEYIEFMREMEASGAADQARNELSRYSIGGSTRQPQASPESSMARDRDARMEWDLRNGRRGNPTEADIAHLLRQRLDAAEAVCSAMLEDGGSLSESHVAWTELVRPPGDIFDAAPLVLDTPDGKTMAVQLEIAESVITSDALVWSCDSPRQLAEAENWHASAVEAWRQLRTSRDSTKRL